jgi:hypothetical protein
MIDKLEVDDVMNPETVVRALAEEQLGPVLQVGVRFTG